MKIRMEESTGCPVPQFVVEAETEDERLMLRAFSTFPDYTKEKWEFRFHGWTLSCGQGATSFNFGWAKAPAQT